MIQQFPHCDQRVLHAPGECEYCDAQPEWQELRQHWGIAFTGHEPRGWLPFCGKPLTEPWHTGKTCRLGQGHDGGCSPLLELEQISCPADTARPPDAPNDHRNWGGNRPA